MGQFIRRAVAAFRNDTCEVRVLRMAWEPRGHGWRGAEGGAPAGKQWPGTGAPHRTCHNPGRVPPPQGHADLVRRIHEALRGAEVSLASALISAAVAAGPSGGAAPGATGSSSLEGWDPEALQALARSRAVVAFACTRIAGALEAVEQEFGPPGSAQSSSSAWAAAGAGEGGGAGAGGAGARSPPLRGGRHLGMYLLRRVEAAQARPAGGASSAGLLPLHGAVRQGAAAAAKGGEGAEEEAAGKLRGLELELPQLRYLDLVEAVKSKDATGCVDALHRYFDFAGASGAARLATAAASAAGGGEAAKGAGLWLSRGVVGSEPTAAIAHCLASLKGAKGLQYLSPSRPYALLLPTTSTPHAQPPPRLPPGCCQGALLGLSAAHAEIGNRAEAARALHEALRLAQQQVHAGRHGVSGGSGPRSWAGLHPGARRLRPLHRPKSQAGQRCDAHG
jgi:hypothetical protein